MTPFLQDADVQLYCGDVLDTLRQLPSESVHMACTSPPFYGLRDYGTGTWEGGDEDCDHAGAPTAEHEANRERAQRYKAEARSTGQHGGWEGRAFRSDGTSVCGKCGARRVDRQIGLEPTPDLWVARLVEVFRELRRVLRSDGTFWLEIGDSYASNPAKGGSGPNGKNEERWGYDRTGRELTCKPKDMIGAPWLLAFALRADGWYLRSEIIWAKPNPMPESVTDRPTTSHSRVFLLSKGPRYFYDAEAIREPSDPVQEAHNRRYAQPYDNEERINGGQPGNVNHVGIHSRPGPGGRNRRSVWTIATESYPEAHFATWPQKLVEPMILAGTSEHGVCPECGAPWERMVESELVNVQATNNSQPDSPLGWDANRTHPRASVATETTGWRPTCSCYKPEDRFGEETWEGPPPVPAVVLDPFAGSGTTLHVARRLGRHAIGIDARG